MIAVVEVLFVFIAIGIYAHLADEMNPMIALLFGFLAAVVACCIFAPWNTHLIGALIGSLFVVIIFSLLLIYDLLLIGGGRYEETLNYDDYVVTACLIYVDIIAFFMLIVWCLSGKD